MIDETNTHECGTANEQSALDETTATDLGSLFRAMGDMNRMRIISLLLDHELCVHDIASLLDMSQSAVSHQLRALRQMRVVRSRRDGRHIYYTLDDDHIRSLYWVGLQHIEDKAQR